MLKAAALTIPRMLLMAVITLLCAAAAELALSLPTQTLLLPIAGWTIPIPLFADMPWSASGLALACAMAIGWLVGCVAPRSTTLQLGVGVIRGLKRERATTAPAMMMPAASVPLSPNPAPTPAPMPQPVPQYHNRSAVLLTLWVIVTMLLGAMPLLGLPISWVPLA